MNTVWVGEAEFWKKKDRKRNSPEILIFLMTLLVRLLIETLTEMGLPW